MKVVQIIAYAIRIHQVYVAISNFMLLVSAYCSSVVSSSADLIWEVKCFLPFLASVYLFQFLHLAAIPVLLAIFSIILSFNSVNSVPRVANPSRVNCLRICNFHSDDGCTTEMLHRLRISLGYELARRFLVIFNMTIHYLPC